MSVFKNLGMRLKGSILDTLESQLIRLAVQTVIKGLKQIVTTVKEVDASMTQLQIVTRATDASMNTFLRAATDAAKELSSNITEVLDSIETFSRLGYNLSDALGLAEAATVM